MRITNIFKFYNFNACKESFKSIQKSGFYKNTKGSMSIFISISVLVSALLFLSVFDIFQLYLAREHTKNASDAIALAVAQNLVFFEKDEIVIIADEMSKKNECEIDSMEFSYDEVIVTTVKKVEFRFAGRFLKNSSFVYSSSKAKVIYPWDEKFRNCDSFIFEF